MGCPDPANGPGLDRGSQAASVSELSVGPSPSLFCFSLMLPFGNEVSLIRSQLAQGAGIFKCNAYTVLSSEPVELSPGPPVRILAQAIPGTLHCDFGGDYHTALNSEIFFRVWQRVFADGCYLTYDWTVKMDADAVFLPERLRQDLAKRNPSDVVYLNNCDEGLHGPIEVVAHGGMKSLARGLDHCRQQLEHEWMTYGEDVWLRRCLGLLGVNRVDDYPMLLRERACKPYQYPMPCTTGAVAFHPLKTPEEYFQCLQQAGR